MKTKLWKLTRRVINLTFRRNLGRNLWPEWGWEVIYPPWEQAACTAPTVSTWRLGQMSLVSTKGCVNPRTPLWRRLETILFLKFSWSILWTYCEPCSHAVPRELLDKPHRIWHICTLDKQWVSSEWKASPRIAQDTPMLYSLSSSEFQAWLGFLGLLGLMALFHFMPCPQVTLKNRIVHETFVKSLKLDFKLEYLLLCRE